MNNNLTLRLGKRCFSFSFLDKEMEAVVKEDIFFSNATGEQDCSFIIGYQHDHDISKDWRDIRRKGETWYYNDMKNGELHVLFPKTGIETDLVRVLTIIYSGFYKYRHENEKNRNSFLIHAAGLIRHGKGFLFTGPSGAGKSTVAKLSIPTAEVLSDENIVVSDVNGNYQISQFPGRTEVTRSNDKIADLCAIFLLTQDKTNSLRKLSKSETVIRLMHNIIYTDILSGVKWEDIIAEKLRLADSICSHVPVYELRFTKHSSFWEEIERLGYI